MSVQPHRLDKPPAVRDGRCPGATVAWPPRRTRAVLSLAATVGLVSLLLIGSARAQAPPQPPPDSSELTEGLLELLNEPTPAPSPARQPLDVPPELTPGDVGLDGEDLGESSSNPLESVRQSMLIAAGMLQRGAADAPTQQLQTGIVQRLDELIAKLEQNQPRPNPSSSPSSPSEQSESSSEPQSTQTRQQTGKQPSPDAADTAQSRPSSQPPGQEGAAADVEVDLADPKALQQNVWGHLPERMRTQMQSRMVEQFLPSYRKQIEAYFKALLE